MELGAAGVGSEVPDVGFAVVPHCAHVDCRLRCPGHSVHAVFVVAEPHDRNYWFSEWAEKYLESIMVT